MPKILTCVQGSEAWCNARAGKPTASEFDQIITPSGAPSKSAPGFCNKLLVETMLGRPLVGAMTGWMQRGKDLEQEAVEYYELMTDATTEPVGLILTDDERIGASPDRLVDEDGLVEAKCPSDEVASKYLSAHIDMLLESGDGVKGSVYAAYRCQVQGQLYVSKRQWCDVIAYYPGLPSATMRIKRDEEFIAALHTELYKFIAMFDQRLEKLKTLGYLDEMAVRRAKGKPDVDPEDLTAFGVSESDINDYIADLKQRGVLTT